MKIEEQVSLDSRSGRLFTTRRNMPSTETRHLCVLIVKWDTLVPGFV